MYFSQYKIADFFAGIGGGSRGFKLLYPSLFKVVYANDIEKKCEDIYNLNNDIKINI